MKLADLFEQFTPGTLGIEFKDALPPTFVIPELQNNDAYSQYRYVIALAAVNAVDKGEVEMSQESAWNENIAIVCYSKEDENIVKKANALMGVKGKQISNDSHELPSTNIKSPVRKFEDLK